VLILGAGGLILGILGTIGGPVTLFKGLDEMQQLAFSQVFSVSDYLLFAVIKLAALVVAAACGFRGGRIFPAVFVGVALGLMLHEHVDAVPAAITVSCSILGLVLVVTRDAWLSLFMAAVVVPDSTLIPLLYRDVARLAPAGGQTDDDGLAKRQIIRRCCALPALW
jgi:H+/Cl- antiporter ClcA